MANKEKQRLKRQQKQRQLRKLKHRSPWHVLQESGVIETCLSSTEWKTTGVAAVTFIIRGRGGLSASVSFDVDVWCRGLIDAVGITDLSDLQVAEETAHLRKEIGVTHTPIDEGRSLVAAGIRFAMENNFRLPEDWRKLAAAVGVTQWLDADLSRFRRDGELYFVGSYDDLEQDYLGDAEQFLDRQDVHFIMQVGGKELDAKLAKQAAVRMRQMLPEAYGPYLNRTIARCQASGAAPSPRLTEALERLSHGVIHALATLEQGDARQLLECAFREVDDYAEELDDAAAADFEQGIEQFLETMTEEKLVADWVEAVSSVMDSIGGDEESPQ